MGLLEPLRDYFDSLVHPSAQQDALTAARHRAFIAPRLLGSFVTLAAFPIYLAMRGVPSVLEVIVFAWLVAPILIAYFLSSTGRYESAHVLSSLALTGLVTVVAFATGGIGSFSAIWLVVVPLEASLSASRRVVALASIFALGAAGLLLMVDAWQLPPPPGAQASQHAALAALGIMLAALYATGLALGAASLARTSFWLLNAEEDRYRLLARNMSDVITRHGRNGAVLFVSPAAEQLVGIGAAKLAGHGLFDRVHVADRPAYLSALADAAAHGEVRSVEFRVRREMENEAGHYVWVEMRCRPLQPVDGEGAEIPEVVAVLRDVSERKAQELALEEANDEAARANAAKNRFLATMSHELRTPLNIIIGFSEMLVNEKPLPLNAARRAEYAHLINESGHHLLSLVNGLLDMSKIETGKFEITPEPFAPRQAVEHCCELLRLKARNAGITLIAAAGDRLPEINADKRALSQILINLVGNAIKFTPREGKITVGAEAVGTHLVFSVEDTGCGIDAIDLPRLGEPFFQSRGCYDHQQGGIGLGLSLVKGLVGLHGGEMKIRSRPGEGTRVEIRLPADCQVARRVITTPKLAPHVTAAVAETVPVQVRKLA